MRFHFLIIGVFTVICFSSAACIGEEDKPIGMDAGPTKAFEKWLRIMENNDYESMWNQLSISAKERFRYAWDDEKESLSKSSKAFKDSFMKTYGFQSWDELQNEKAEEFFVRAMGNYPKTELPRKYEILKKAKIHDINYVDGGTACILTFLDEDGSPLPMKMKMLREGSNWKVVRLP